MKIGIIGGTGSIGEGMAMRFSQHHTVLIGSRDVQKAGECATECTRKLADRKIPCELSGCLNQEAIDRSEIIILAIPYAYVAPTLKDLRGLEGNIVVSPVNPMVKADYVYYAPPPEGSAGLAIRKLLPPAARLCVAFNTIAAGRWRDLESPLEYSVPVCSDDEEAKQQVMRLAESIPGIEALDGGPLRASSMVETLTPLLITLGMRNNRKDMGMRFISPQGGGNKG
jgi:NADPH-dependent F420 reductase